MTQQPVKMTLEELTAWIQEQAKEKMREYKDFSSQVAFLQGVLWLLDTLHRSMISLEVIQDESKS